jgi:hypothetical protein
VKCETYFTGASEKMLMAPRLNPLRCVFVENNLTGQAPVKFAALQFYELFNWAGTADSKQAGKPEGELRRRND